MRERNDSREVRPRIGSPLWTYLSVITAAGAAALGVAVWWLAGRGLPRLIDQPLVWVIAALALVGELRPIVTPGKWGKESSDASLVFCFAALLYWGFPVAALIGSAIRLAGAVVVRRAPLRAAFGAAQYTFSLMAAGLVLALAGIRPRPLAPWMPGGGGLLAVALAGLAYFAVNFLLVRVAVAMHTRVSVAAVLRRDVPSQAFGSLVLLAAAPLVVVVMARSVLLVLLFLLPMLAIYVSAAISLQREHQAHHDELTGLPNRALLLSRTADAVAEAGRAGTRTGFLLLDLDRFKEVNDTLGHPVGDCLLKMVAHRLAHSVRPGDMVARLGGDEFAVLLPAVREARAAREVAARLRAALSQPIHLSGMSFEVEASVGIALCPDDATGVELLMQRADVAMYLAKERRTGVETYAPDADRNSAARLSLLGDLRRGLDRGEIVLHYQPKVSLADGRTGGMEALVRWRHPLRGMIMPADFIPAAQQSGLMRDLTACVIDAALTQAARWRREGLGVPVSVNVAARDLLDGALAGTVEAGLSRHGLAPGDLVLEISERALTDEMGWSADERGRAGSAERGRIAVGERGRVAVGERGRVTGGDRWLGIGGRVSAEEPGRRGTGERWRPGTGERWRPGTGERGRPDTGERGRQGTGERARLGTGEPATAAATLDALAARGVPISLDDFGTGYSSLVRLKRLPLTEIKIDACFITRLFDSPSNELIVKSLVELARALGIRPVAEGVETADVARALAAMGCEGAQGWYFGAPLDPAAATEFLAGERAEARRAAESVADARRAAERAAGAQRATERAVSQQAPGRLAGDRVARERLAGERPASDRPASDRPGPGGEQRAATGGRLIPTPGALSAS